MSEPVITDGGSAEVVAVDTATVRIAPSESSATTVRTQSDTSTVTPAPEQQVTVTSKDGLPGEPGAPGRDGTDGAPGEPGPQGPPGINANAAYVHYQNMAAAIWLIQHNLGFYPNVTVEDSAGSVVEGELAYLDTNNVQLTFTAAFGGVAYLS